MRRTWLVAIVLGVLLSLIPLARAWSGDGDKEQDKNCSTHFVPNSLSFWDFSKNWPTNYGPAYRDTNLAASNFLPCTGEYALCFDSGPRPLACDVDKDGRFARCKCMVEKGLNFVLITSILNYEVYKETVAVCGSDGSGCSHEIDKAPVCKYLRNGKLIPGADIVSDFSPQLQESHNKITLAQGSGGQSVTECPKGPYAGCMTAPCQIRNGFAECSCPVFWGPFQLTQEGAQCSLGGDQVWSASYTPGTSSSSQK